MGFDQGTFDAAMGNQNKVRDVNFRLSELASRLDKRLDKSEKLNATLRKRIWRLEKRVTKLKGSI